MMTTNNNNSSSNSSSNSTSNGSSDDMFDLILNIISIVGLTGPIIAFGYGLLVYIVYAVTGECKWADTQKIKSSCIRFAFLIVSVVVSIYTKDEIILTKQRLVTEVSDDQKLMEALVISSLLAAFFWIISIYFMYQTRIIDVVGVNTNSIPFLGLDKKTTKMSSSCSGSTSTVTNQILHDQVVLITGANTGIGKETAKQLALLGATIIMACRSSKRAQDAIDDILLSKQEKSSDSLKKEQFIILQLDLSNFESIRTAVKLLDTDEYISKLPKCKQQQQKSSAATTQSRMIDILICNAGVMMSTKTQSVDGYEVMMQANHLGHYLLVKLLMSKLLQITTKTTPPTTTTMTKKEEEAKTKTKKTNTYTTTPARIICVTSSTYAFSNKTGFDFDDMFCDNSSRNYTLFGQYSMTKLANILMVKELHQRYVVMDEEDSNLLQVYAVHPGIVRTDVVRNMGWFFRYGNLIFAKCVAAFQKTPSEGAYSTVYCAVHDEYINVMKNSKNNDNNDNDKKKNEITTDNQDIWKIPSGSYVVNCKEYPTLPCANSLEVRLSDTISLASFLRSGNHNWFG